MSQKTHPRTDSISIVRDEHVMISYEVILGEPDQAFVYWLIADDSGEMVRRRFEIAAPNAVGLTNQLFNSTKELVE